jgi:hypothetical protein
MIPPNLTGDHHPTLKSFGTHVKEIEWWVWLPVKFISTMDFESSKISCMVQSFASGKRMPLKANRVVVNGLKVSCSLLT